MEIGSDGFILQTLPNSTVRHASLTETSSLSSPLPGNMPSPLAGRKEASSNILPSGSNPSSSAQPQRKTFAETVAPSNHGVPVDAKFVHVWMLKNALLGSF